MARLGGYAVTKGIELLRGLMDQGLVVFTTEDAEKMAKVLGIGRGHSLKLLHELRDGQWIRRIRRGLYHIDTGMLGLTTIHPFVVATHLVRPSAISHWSALNFHGFTEQVPLTVTATTPKKVVTPSMRETDTRRKSRHTWKIGMTEYEYVSVKHDHYFGLEDIWLDEHFRVSMTDKERTILDCFAFPRMFGGIQWVLSTLEEVIDRIDTEKLVAYAKRYGRVSIMKRLGWALESLGVPRVTLAPLRRIKSSAFYELDRMRVKRGVYDHDWMIVDNLAQRIIS